MVNPAHEALLRQGIEEWNDWRASNGSVTPELAGIRLPAASFAGADLSHAKLRNAVLIRVKLKGADLRYADLRGAQLHEADLTDADLFKANLRGAVLAGATLRRARLYGACLRGAQITVADFRKADLREADLRHADLRESMATGASLEGANLSRVELYQCHLGGCNLLRVCGLTSRQLEEALVDETTRLPDRLGGSDPPGESLESLYRSLQVLKNRIAGEATPETLVLGYHALLEKLEAHGVPTRNARIPDSELVRPVTSWERTTGGEAFEVDSRQWVDAALFRRKLDEILDTLRKKVVAP